ncbi:cation transporter [Rapidithrix thailandica]|uniref:Cation transporter n=1 Tax=Rapidithrix thailandica TaxID=413964 RepID=A0AAW9SA34_9BACT
MEGKKQQQLFQRAWWLALISILYNILEGGISTYFGIDDETLALFGFGMDSFVEVISGLGIAHLYWRLRKHNIAQRDRFEVTALKVTGTAFYLLTVSLVLGASFQLWQQKHPVTTLSGIIIAILSILTMYFLYQHKLSVGRKLNSAPIIADAKCTLTCFRLSLVLLISSLLYEWLHLPYIDAAGSLVIAWFAYKEGKEAFQKARTGALSCGCKD